VLFWYQVWEIPGGSGLQVFNFSLGVGFKKFQTSSFFGTSVLDQHQSVAAHKLAVPI
jgi:hypothetical protein